MNLSSLLVLQEHVQVSAGSLLLTKAQPKPNTAHKPASAVHAAAITEATPHSGRSGKDRARNQGPHKADDMRHHPQIQQTSQLHCVVLDEISWSQPHLG